MALNLLHLTSLDRGIRHANAVGADTEESKHLLRSALAIRRLRAAAIASDWTSAEQLLQDAERADVVPQCAAEVRRFREELEARRMTSELEAAIREGSGVVQLDSGSGSTGSPSLDASAVGADAIEAAVARADEAAASADPGSAAPRVR